MANDLTGNPWTLDTASSGVVLFSGQIWVRHFEFIDYPADADNVTIKDRFGRVVWKANGASDLQPIRSGTVGTIHGLVFDASSNAANRVRVYWE